MTCDSYRTISNDLLVCATGNKRSESRVITTGVRLETVTPLALYGLLTGKSSSQLIEEYKNGMTQKEKKNFIKMALNPLSPYSPCFEKTARERILRQVLDRNSTDFSKTKGTVSLNEISHILSGDSQLLDRIFDSNFCVLAELLDTREGSRIATALGFHRIIMKSNTLIRIDLDNRSHTIRYSNPGKCNLKFSKFFLCWNNETLLECTSSTPMDEAALEVRPDFVFLAIDLPVALFKVLVSIADKAVSSTNQEKLLWQHGATEIVSPQVETKLHPNPIDSKVSPGGKRMGEKRNPVKKSVNRRVSWNSLHHLKR